MMKVTVIGAEGFVGSAFISYLANHSGLDVVGVTRCNYAQIAGVRSDVVIDAAGNSKKYLAEDQPVEDFGLSVTHRLRTLRDFPATLHLHVSSADVYDDLSLPEMTREDSLINLARVSHYGFHKLMAEQLVQHYASQWLIVRLAGMVGLGLRKNPVYDILHAHPLRIHPDSQYQFMTTRDVARIIWMLVERGISGEIFNICGDGLVSPAEIARLAECELDLSLLKPMLQPRIVHINIEKINRITPMPSTDQTIVNFVRDWRRGQCREDVATWAI